MKRIGKPVFFIVALLILVFSYASFFGISGQRGDFKETYIKGASDIRWGIDIRGGVEATFSPADGVKATKEQMDSAKSIIEVRLVKNNITDYELYVDYNNGRIIVRFPWKVDEKDFNAEKAIQELSATALLTFREGGNYATTEQGSDGKPIYKTPTGVTESNIILQGTDIKTASPQVYENKDTQKMEYIVSLELNQSGIDKFKEATTKAAAETPHGVISIWMDDVMISSPQVNGVIDGGQCQIEGSESSPFTAEEVTDLANKINAGALPFKLTTTNYGSINPTLGESSLKAMLIAGIIAMIIICAFMLVVYRLPGFVACIALIGQVGLSFAAVSGFFSFLQSFTLTLPGIAGIILSMGMGVDANIITASRIKEEIWNGKTLDGAIRQGTKSSFWAIFDGNITVIIVAIILMAVFGPSNILSWIFGESTTGSIYSFGYTLLIGVFGNFIMGVTATRLMVSSLSRMKFARSKWLYGGAKNNENA